MTRSIRWRDRILRILMVATIVFGGRVFSVAADARSISAALATITQAELKRHVGFLAGDALEGREAGTRGGKAAALYLVAELEKRKNLRPAGDEGTFQQSFGNGYRNILAVLPGSDPKRKHECIVVCAHFDHVGYGTEKNSLGPIGSVHNGADDNASGTAAVLEVMDALTRLKEPPSRSILFAFWDAEEKGLLGSEHWVKHPTLPLKNIILQLNSDMVGRMRNNLVAVHGTRSAVGLRRFVSERNREDGLNIHFQWTLKRESDHYPFLEAGIPAVMLDTGKHADYHRPSDDVQKLNAAGMQQCARLLARLAVDAAESGFQPEFRRQCFLETDDHRKEWFAPLSDLPPRLGLAWDVEKAKQGRIEVADITTGMPANHAGFKTGDRITRFGDVAVTGPTQFRGLVMSAVNPVAAMVERAGESKPVRLTVHLTGSPRRVGIAWGTDNAEPGTVILRWVVAGSPADRAGLKLHDRVLAINGKPFRTSDGFRDRIAKPNGALRLTVERAGKQMTVALRFPDSAADHQPVPARRP